MRQPDVVLIHPPSVFDFRDRTIFYGPISDVIPSSPVFEMYPIGFLTLATHLRRHGYRVRIVNLALLMMRSRRFRPERFLRRLRPRLFGIDLHWLPHAQAGPEVAALLKRLHPGIPIVFGGISATYFHEELIRNDAVDFDRLRVLSPASPHFIARIDASLQCWGAELSPETHDESIRARLGKATFTNEQMESAIESILATRCEQLDLFYMIGHGYVIRARTLADHRRLLEQRDWESILNYETRWMTRTEIVDATYEAAERLNDLKEHYGRITSRVAAGVRGRLVAAKSIRHRLAAAGEEPLEPQMHRLLAGEIRAFSEGTINDKTELFPPGAFLRNFRISGIARFLARDY